MKRFSHFLMAALVAVVVLAAVGCSEDIIETPPPAPTPTPTPTPTPDSIEFAEGKTTFIAEFAAVAEPIQVKFTASQSWSAAKEPAAEWFTLSADKGDAGESQITLTVAENTGAKTLTSVITLICGDAKATIFVSQEGHDVIGFELAEKMLGINGELTALREIILVSGASSANFADIYWAKEYTEANDLRDDYDQLYFASPLFSTAGGDIWFSSYYCDCTIYGAQYDAWGGFILSSNVNTTVEPGVAGIPNQFEAYASASTSKNVFTVAYDAKTAGMAMSADCCWPQIDFTEQPRTLRSIALANSTWTYDYFRGDAADSYVVKIVGMLNKVETGSVECPLISGAEKVADWTTFDLTTLGEVDCLVFSVVSSEKYAPFYFCMDNLALNK